VTPLRGAPRSPIGAGTGTACRAGSPHRTRPGKIAAKYHTARFTVPALPEELAVATTSDRGLGRTWQPVTAAAPPATGAPTRIGHALCSTANQELASQLDALAGRSKVIDIDMLTFARSLRNKSASMPEIAKKLTITSGKNADKNPSVASHYRDLADAS
jgi:hypothetical protein